MPFDPDESTYKQPPARQWNDLTDAEKRDIIRHTPQPGLQELPVERTRQPEISRHTPLTPPPARDRGIKKPVLH